MDENAWRLLDRRVETARFGPFTFQIGVDPNAVALPLQRVEDAHQRFIAAPLSQVANQLEREVVAGSVFGQRRFETSSSGGWRTSRRPTIMRSR